MQKIIKALQILYQKVLNESSLLTPKYTKTAKTYGKSVYIYIQR